MLCAKNIKGKYISELLGCNVMQLVKSLHFEGTYHLHL
jgi:hypothetical protein